MGIFFDENALKSAIIEIAPSGRLYPSTWREFKDAPARLYAIGDISLMKERKIAIVGSRRTPVSALKLGGEIVGALSEKIAIVTGAADGGDTAALEGALKRGGKVVCLLAGGFSALPQFNIPLLEKVARKGLLLSPHPFETPIRSFSYEYRNKLLAALCEGVFVLGAGEKSGALTTARYAKARNLPVFALPYAPNSVYGCGCNKLIKEGGYLVENAADIACRLAIDLREEEEAVVLNEEEKIVYLALKERGECHVSELAAALSAPIFKIKGLLSALEVKGVVLSLGGNRYAIVK